MEIISVRWLLIETVPHAQLQRQSNSVRPNSQGVDRYAQVCRQLPAVLDLGVLFLLIILHHQFAIIAGTLLEAFILRLNVVCEIHDGDILTPHEVRGNFGLRLVTIPEILLINLLSYSVKVECGITVVTGGELDYLGTDTINSLVGQAFSLIAAAASKDFYQARANRLVSVGGAFAVGIQPIE